MRNTQPEVRRVGAARVQVLVQGASLLPTADGAACCCCCSSCCGSKNPK